VTQHHRLVSISIDYLGSEPFNQKSLFFLQSVISKPQFKQIKHFTLRIGREFLKQGLERKLRESDLNDIRVFRVIIY